MIEKERTIIFKKRRKTNRESIGGINEPILLAKLSVLLLWYL